MTTLPSLESVMERYKTACYMKQTIDRERITIAIQAWIKQITKEKLTIRFAETEAEFWRCAREAWEAWEARRANGARRAWEARGARGAWEARGARDARRAWGARDARRAWGARGANGANGAWGAWGARDVSWVSTIAVGAIEVGDAKQYAIWISLLEAFEAGAWILYFLETEIVIGVIPTRMVTDTKRRLHCEDAPAFSWLDGNTYYWHGTIVPEKVIMQPDSITIEDIDTEENIEVRRAMIERMGYEKYLKAGEAKIVDQTEEGTLYHRPRKEDTPIALLSVKDTTGGHMYYLRVNPRLNTVREARMSTIRFDQWMMTPNNAVWGKET